MGTCVGLEACPGCIQPQSLNWIRKWTDGFMGTSRKIPVYFSHYCRVSFKSIVLQKVKKCIWMKKKIYFKKHKKDWKNRLWTTGIWIFYCGLRVNAPIWMIVWTDNKSSVSSCPQAKKRHISELGVSGSLAATEEILGFGCSQRWRDYQGGQAAAVAFRLSGVILCGFQSLFLKWSHVGRVD